MDEQITTEDTEKAQSTLSFRELCAAFVNSVVKLRE